MKNLRNMVGLALAGLTIGCGAEMGVDGEDLGVETVEQAISTSNGLAMINGLTMTNGLAMVNGLSMVNGLAMSNGLDDKVGLMSSAGGRKTVEYMVRCALRSDQTISKVGNDGVRYTFRGALGFAPSWANGHCDTRCQEYVSACLVAHVNTSGVNVPLWIVADPSAQPHIGWGLSSSYPNQEGSFFGNIFANPPVMNYCNGRNYDVNTVPGRIGYDDSSSKPYRNPYGYNTRCDTHCARADYPNDKSGYKACGGYNGVVTVWRK